MTESAVPSTLVAATPGIVEIALPTPFSVGTVNAYLLEGDPLTLVDCGPATADALIALCDGLREAGWTLADLELVILTHGHVDHAGLAALLAERHGVRVACLAGLADELSRWTEHATREDDYAADTMVRHGVPPQVVAAIHASVDVVRGLSGDVMATDRLAAGDVIEAGSRGWRVHHRPGHSRWDTVLVDEASGTAIFGDHLLLHTSANAALLRPSVAGGARVTPLLDMRRSLIATRALGVRIGLAGHGPRFADVDVLVDKRLAQQDSRAARIEQLLREHGPTDAHRVAEMLLGERATTQALLAISEVVGHIDLLIAEGIAIEHTGAALCQFEVL